MQGEYKMTEEKETKTCQNPVKSRANVSRFYEDPADPERSEGLCGAIVWEIIRS